MAGVPLAQPEAPASADRDCPELRQVRHLHSLKALRVHQGVCGLVGGDPPVFSGRLRHCEGPA
eukprot:4439299-Lingulodinium_polyedra.AAC.1